MACNFKEDRKLDKDGVKAAGGGGLSADSGGGESQKLLSASAATTSRQNGDQAGCEDEQMSEQDAAERRRSSLSDARRGGGSPSTLNKSAEELPRRNFQIPRKIKERKGLLQMLPPESREFEELVKVLSSFYLDASSRGAFTYTKACLIHSELMEKEFVEKKRELKQAGRTEAELTESYAFLMPDTNKTHWICEKGLSVGHARLSNLGNPAKGVYLSKYSDLLQINPFDAGASGDIIIFKVMKGRLKSIFENMPKSNLEPAPKFDCHVHKNASKVTSLLSYRAFELTQQYFYEFAYDELKSRPRHVCPYAVVSFQYKGKESATAAHRLSSSMHEGNRVRRRYTVWSGPLVNRGEELYQVCIRSPSLPFLPLKLPDKIDISMAMHLDQVKRKIPSTLLSWDTYSGTREALKCGMYASLFEVMGKTKQGNCLSGLLQRMEREKMVLVKPLVDRGFLFLLSSSHMHSSNERRGRNDRGLQALFIFQEPRITTRFFSKHAGHHEAVPLEPKDPITEHLDTFIPALHHAFFKLRSNLPRDLGAGVKNQALDYLGVQEQGMGRPFLVPEYRTSMDERPNLHPAPRPKGMDSALNSYMYGPSNFQLPVMRLQQGLVDSGQGGCVSPPGGGAEEYSPVSDWGGSDRASSSGRAGPAPAQSNGSAQRSQKGQTEYDKEKMEKLLKLIQLHKRARGKDDVCGPERSEEWDAAGLKRRLEGDVPTSVSKYLNTGLLSNGEQGRVPQGDKSLSLSTVMDDMGLCDTDLRDQVTNSASLQDTQALLKLFLSALNKVAQGSTAAAAAVAAAADAVTATTTPAASSQHQDSLGPPEATTHCDRDLRPRPAEEDQGTQDYLEACSISSMDLCSPSSSIEQQPSRTSEPPSSHNRLQWRAGSTVSDPGVDVLVTDKSGQASGKMLDSILDQEFQNLCTGIQKVMESHQILYVSQPCPPWHKGKVNGLDSTFSSYVSKYVSPPTVQTYVNTLCEKMNRIICSPGAPSNSVANPAAPTVTAPLPLAPVPAPTPPSPAAAAPPPTVPAPPASLHSKQPAAKLKSHESLHKPTAPDHKPHTPSSTLSPTPALKKHLSPTSKPPRLGTIKEVHMDTQGKKSDPKVPNIAESPKCLPSVGITALPLIPELPPDPAQAGGSNVIGQIKPEVLCTLMEIMQMNAVRFYIQRGEQDENELCTEIKVYLQSLGNIECDPQTYLQNNCQQKFMVIIQNEDIATHVHKIPALVSLKKLSTVYFAGVDSLDDVKNRTYNELFVSGGLIVSDELILTPDYITLEKMQMFLQFLEGQNMLWKWKVHCKTQKKLKELSRLNSEALDLLNLLTIYQKKHLVEFLPYHECDAPSRQAPDLDCLVKLQAQHSQLRHIILLTDKPFDVPKFSSNGIMIASITDIMTNFEGLISSTKSEVPSPLAPETDACVDEEDMSLDSDEDASSAAVVSKNIEEERNSLPPLPKSEEFRPPLPDLPVQDPLSSIPVDYNALKLAISEYKASRQSSTSSTDLEDSLTSFGVNPHQSYLYPSSAQWSPYSGSPGYHVGSAYSSPACSTSQGQELSQSSTMSITQGSAAAAAPLSQPSSLLQANPSTLTLNPPTLHPTNLALLPPASNSPLPMPQASTGNVAEALQVPQATSCPQAQADIAMVALTSSISQDVQNKAIESTALTSSSSLSSSSLPTYPEPSMFPALTPIPPVPPVPILNWAAAPGPHQSYPPGVNRGAFGPLPSSQNEAARTLSSPAVNSLWTGAGECGTLNSKVEGSTPGSAPSTVPLQEAGLEKGSTPGSLTPSSQGSRTPLNSCPESHGIGPPQPQAGGPASSRGGAAAAAIPRGLLPRPGAIMGPMCRGGPQGMGSHGGGGGSTYGPRGPMPGTMPGLMDMMRGGYRGRGPPPIPMRSRPSRGPMRGSCNWGYPSGRGGGGVPDYYSDHPYP